MSSPSIADVDHDEGLDDFNNIDFGQHGQATLGASQYNAHDTDKENGIFPASQPHPSQRSMRSQQMDDDANHLPRTPYNSQLPRTPHPKHAETDGGSLGATSEVLNHSGGLTPPTTAPRPASARPASARPASATALKRKLAEVANDHEAYFPADDPFDSTAFADPINDEEDEDFINMANTFDPTAEVSVQNASC
jgi:hypothetical protein